MERFILLALVLGESLAAWRRLHLRRGGGLARVLGPAGTERLGHCTCGKLWQVGPAQGRHGGTHCEQRVKKNLLVQKLVALPI